MNKRKLNELRNLLLKNCLDDNGDLVISNIDLGDFKGNVILKSWKVGGDVDLSSWKVKGNLNQSCQNVNGTLYQVSQTADDLFQDCQVVSGNLNQSCQDVNGDLDQSYQEVEGNLYDHKLKEGEEWKELNDVVMRVKKLKEISLEELEEMGYKLKEKN